MEGKDRMGDKLREKGKGDEDRYFAEQEQRKLEALRLQKEGGAAPRGLCPRDGAALTPRQHGDVTADECPDCGGIWLDQGELEVIVRQGNQADITRWLRGFLRT